MKLTLEHRQKKITDAIIKALKEQFGEDPVEFETIWPVTCWDRIQTETRGFTVKLKMSNGKLEFFEEEF